MNNRWHNLLAAGLMLLLANLLLSACGGSSSASDSYQPSGAIEAPRLLFSTAHGGGQGWGQAKCFTCHPMSKVENAHVRVPVIRDSLVRLSAKIGGEADRACLACHDTNGLDPVASRECLICHGDNDIVAGARMFSGAHQHTITKIGGSAQRDADCIICHERSNMDGVFERDVDLTRFSGSSNAWINDFCLACHDVSGAAGILPPPLRFPEPPEEPLSFSDLSRTFLGAGTTDAERQATADFHGFGRGTDPATKPILFGGNTYRPGYDQHDHSPLACTDCHLVHASSNPYLITDSGARASMLDQDEPARNAGVAVTERNFEQLCAVCHTNPEGVEVGNGLQAHLHFTGYTGDCVSCHFHGAGFISNLF